MKTLLSFYFVVVAVLLFQTRAEARTETDLSSFLHQVTLTQDSTSVTTRQWIYPVRIFQAGKYGSLEIQSALMYVHQEDSTVVDTWGPLDTHASARLRLGAWGLLDLTAGLPSGKNNLEASEANLVRTLSRSDLNFPIKTFGQGLDLGIAGSLVNQAGHYGLSLGFSYVRKGIYTPLEGLGRYKPGDEAAVSLGLHYTRSRLSLHINAVGTVYLTDRLEGLVIFQNAKQFLLQAGLAYSGKTIQIRAELTEIARLKNRMLAANQFLYESRDSNGNDFRAHLETGWTPPGPLTLFARADVKHLTANAYPSGHALHQGRAVLWGGAAGLSFSLGGNNKLVLRIARWEGNAEDRLVELSAYHVRGAFTFGF